MKHVDILGVHLYLLPIIFFYIYYYAYDNWRVTPQAALLDAIKDKNSSDHHKNFDCDTKHKILIVNILQLKDLIDENSNISKINNSSLRRLDALRSIFLSFM